MVVERKSYLVYLLRLWQAGQQSGTTWRARLEDAHTGEARGFASLEELYDFLRKQVEGFNQGVGDRSDHPSE